MRSSNLSDVDLAARVAKLTAGQRECLDLVDDHATSKEIARQIGISRHTVDARLRGAIQTLGVSSRREAAIIYRAAAQAQVQSYQSFAYQTSQIESTPQAEPKISGAEPERLLFPEGDYSDLENLSSRAETQPGLALPEGSVHRLADSAAYWGDVPPSQPSRSTPTFRLWGGENDLTPGQKMLGIMVITITAMLAFGMFLSGIQVLINLRS